MAIVPIKSGKVCHLTAQSGIETHNLGENKAALRRALLARRMALTPEQRQRRAQQLTRELWAWLTECVEPNAAIALYWAFRAEIDLQALMDEWRARGGRVYLPIVQQPKAPLKFAPYRGLASMHAGSYGILEPMYEAHELCEQPDDLAVLCAPCVGFNAQGYRLGYGGGFYDRTLANWRAQGMQLPITVGVADAWAQIDFLPDAFDVPFDMLCLADET